MHIRSGVWGYIATQRQSLREASDSTVVCELKKETRLNATDAVARISSCISGEFICVMKRAMIKYGYNVETTRNDQERLENSSAHEYYTFRA